MTTSAIEFKVSMLEDVQYNGITVKVVGFYLGRENRKEVMIEWMSTTNSVVSLWVTEAELS